MASIAAMRLSRPIFAPLCAIAAAAALAGCGSDDLEPSIPAESALTLIGTLQEIQANVDAGSCLVAGDKVDELKAEISELPAEVNDDVSQALENGADQLAILVSDPAECERPAQPDTTTQETTTQQTTTEQPTTQQTTTAPPTTTTAPPPTTTTAPPTNPGGGVSPPGGTP
jgi:hypothetical protein